uniref:Uncharacterized protein n=1 Tax=Spongospora subterranea TaxID=70186 RepID=A0A0H5RSW1_9EUKA|eukprot:CRZ11804.1 hypothetical protein [Spongospora subterranea]
MANEALVHVNNFSDSECVHLVDSMTMSRFLHRPLLEAIAARAHSISDSPHFIPLLVGLVNAGYRDRTLFDIAAANINPDSLSPCQLSALLPALLPSSSSGNRGNIFVRHCRRTMRSYSNLDFQRLIKAAPSSSGPVFFRHASRDLHYRVGNVDIQYLSSMIADIASRAGTSCIPHHLLHRACMRLIRSHDDNLNPLSLLLPVLFQSSGCKGLLTLLSGRISSAIDGQMSVLPDDLLRQFILSIPDTIPLSMLSSYLPTQSFEDLIQLYYMRCPHTNDVVLAEINARIHAIDNTSELVNIGSIVNDCTKLMAATMSRCAQLQPNSDDICKLISINARDIPLSLAMVIYRTLLTNQGRDTDHLLPMFVRISRLGLGRDIAVNVAQTLLSRPEHQQQHSHLLELVWALTIIESFDEDIWDARFYIFSELYRAHFGVPISEKYPALACVITMGHQEFISQEGNRPGAWQCPTTGVVADAVNEIDRIAVIVNRNDMLIGYRIRPCEIARRNILHARGWEIRSAPSLSVVYDILSPRSAFHKYINKP